MKNSRNALLISAASILAVLFVVYAVFVFQCLWNWFLSPALELHSISFLEMLGICLAITTFFGITHKDETETEKKRWKILLNVIETFVPEEKRQLIEQAARIDESFKLSSFIWLFYERVGGLTICLSVGWLLNAISSGHP